MLFPDGKLSLIYMYIDITSGFDHISMEMEGKGL